MFFSDVLKEPMPIAGELIASTSGTDVDSKG
jgi:hypothetical protein